MFYSEYDRVSAVAYAKKWALSVNPLFYSFSKIGGDCTNFVSQCLLAGSCVMNFTPTYGWYYLSTDERSASWTGVSFFFDFLTGNASVGPFGHVCDRAELLPGDVLQLGHADGSFYHSALITEITPAELFVCAHSEDSLDRPLSSYRYDRVRFLHVDGVRRDTRLRVPCFGYLMGNE